MFYPKLRHAPSNSIIDISSTQTTSRSHSIHVLQRKKQAFHRNQNRARSSDRLFRLANDDDDFHQKFLPKTKKILDQLFIETNFDQILDRIEYTLQPIVKQFRSYLAQKQHLSKQEQLICMTSCAEFITQTMEKYLDEQPPWETNINIEKFHDLQRVLERFQAKQSIRSEIPNQLTDEMMRLHIDKDENEKVPVVDDLRTRTVRTSDDLIRQKKYHRSVSHAFKKLNADLQKMNHETPFQAHLSKYHTHNH